MSSDNWFTVVVKGAPQPKQRAAPSGGRMITPAATRRYEALVGRSARGVLPKDWPLDANYHMDFVFFMPDNRRRDVDNCMKSVMDGLNGVAYIDDSSVVSGTFYKELDRKNPRAVITIRIVDPNDT